jgi:lipopolysaccharide transport system ATP-binding protein
VLSVGDAAFQRRCLSKMNEAANSGRTILFVSHDMAAIESFCSRCLLLEAGQIVEDGPGPDVVATYWRRIAAISQDSPEMRTDREGNGAARVTGYELLDGSGRRVSAFSAGGEARIRLTLVNAEPISLPRVVLTVVNSCGHRLFTIRSFAAGWQEPISPPATTFTCSIPSLMLVPGTYFLEVLIRNQGDILDCLDPLCSFDVLPADVFGTGHCPDASTGVMLVESLWEAEPRPELPAASNALCKAAGRAIA